MRKQLHIIFRLVMFSCILLFVSQEASAQITFSVKNQTIRQTIRVIEKKADYSFFYTDKLPVGSSFHPRLSRFAVSRANARYCQELYDC